MVAIVGSTQPSAHRPKQGGGRKAYSEDSATGKARRVGAPRLGRGVPALVRGFQL